MNTEREKYIKIKDVPKRMSNVFATFVKIMQLL